MASTIQNSRVGKANGSRECAPDDKLRVPTSSYCAVGTAQARLCPLHETAKEPVKNTDLILRSLRSKRLEGSHGHPSRRAQERAPQDEAGYIFRDLEGRRSSIPRRQ